MGLCGSKSQQPSQVPPRQTDDMTRTATVGARTTTTTNTTTRGKQEAQSPIGGKTNNGSKERKLLENSTQSRLSPREAARIAAERRLEEQNSKLTKGELGKKLAKERAKTYRK